MILFHSFCIHPHNKQPANEKTSNPTAPFLRKSAKAKPRTSPVQSLNPRTLQMEVLEERILLTTAPSTLPQAVSDENRYGVFSSEPIPAEVISILPASLRALIEEASDSADPTDSDKLNTSFDPTGTLPRSVPATESLSPQNDSTSVSPVHLERIEWHERVEKETQKLSFGAIFAPDGTVISSDRIVHCDDPYEPVDVDQVDIPQRVDRNGNRLTIVPGIAFDTNVDERYPYRIIAVNESRQKVILIAPDGTKIGEFGHRGSKLGEFHNPNSIALDSEGLMYITDSGNHRVQVFSPQGEALHEFGNEVLVSPGAITVDSEKIVYVCDRKLEKIFIFENGNLRGCIENEFLKQPGPMSLRQDGLLAVAVHREQSWYVDFYSSSGEFLGTILVSNEEKPERINGLSYREDGTLLISQENHGATFYSIPASPENFTIQEIDSGTMTLEWDEVLFATNYRLEYSPDGSNGSWSTMIELNSTHFFLTGAYPGYYRIGACGRNDIYFYSQGFRYGLPEEPQVTEIENEEDSRTTDCTDDPSEFVWVNAETIERIVFSWHTDKEYLDTGQLLNRYTEELWAAFLLEEEMNEITLEEDDSFFEEIDSFSYDHHPFSRASWTPA